MTAESVAGSLLQTDDEVATRIVNKSIRMAYQDRHNNKGGELEWWRGESKHMQAQYLQGFESSGEGWKLQLSYGCDELNRKGTGRCDMSPEFFREEIVRKREQK